jgi:predicted phage gp36 major capsid-like protein
MTTTARTNANSPVLHSPDLDGLQARFGVRVAAMLGERAAATHPDITERLRFAREQALARGQAARRQHKLAAAESTTVVGRGGSAVLANRPGWWVKLASAMPLAMLVCGLVVIDRLHDRAQIAAAAEVDAALLSDDLPPAAYTDPGFAEYLKTAQE